MSDFGFVGGAYEAGSVTQDTQQLINYYPEIDPTKEAGSRGVIALYPTPGLNMLVQLDAVSEVRGCHVLAGYGNSIVACGNILYNVTSAFSPTRIGTLLTSTGTVSITDNGLAVYLADGSNRYFYPIQSCVFNGTISSTTLTVNSLTQSFVYIGMPITGVGVTAGTVITAGSGTSWTVNNSQTVGPVAMTGAQTLITVTDGAFNGANIVDVTDNYIVYNSPNSNQWGCTNVSSIVSGGLNFASALSAPGNLTGLICDHRQVYLLGEYTTEIWSDVGSFPFPFQCIPGSTIQHGCNAIGSLARFSEGFCFLAQDRRGHATVLMIQGYQSQRISTHAIETSINSYTVTADAKAYVYADNGHEFYVVTFPTADKTWVFDMASNMWHERVSRDENNIFHRHRSNCMMYFSNKIIVGDYQNGQLYEMTTSALTDNGTPIIRRRRCQHLTKDLKRIFYSSLQIQFQPGTALQSGQGSDPSCIVRWSDDGGNTFGNDHIVKIGQAGRYKNRAIVRRLGYARDRVYEVDMTDPIYAPIISANLEANSGSN